MISKGTAARCAVGVVGGLMLAGVGSAAYAAWPDAEGSAGVDVNVEIEAQQDGALSLTVASTQTALTEDGSTATYRQFTGTLPEVTVTDTRDDVPAGVYWYVTGQASDFESEDGQSTIPANQLGWSPAPITDGDGEVVEGEEVLTALDDPENPSNPNNTGLASGENFLYLSLDSADAKAVQGSWSTTADLTLKTETDVEPGKYSSLLTLSLFEDEA